MRRPCIVLVLLSLRHTFILLIFHLPNELHNSCTQLLLQHTPLYILGHCVTADWFPGLCESVILDLYTLLKPPVVESQHKFSIFGPMPAQSFLSSADFLRERMRGQNVSGSCYQMPNTEEFPAHVTSSQDSDLRQWGAVEQCRLLLSTWRDSQETSAICEMSFFFFFFKVKLMVLTSNMYCIKGAVSNVS